MWLKAFQYEDKLLSETEFWILTLVEDEYEAPTEIISRLIEQTSNWTPKPGTIYPILHRLAEAGLLDKEDADGLLFQRSADARTFLSSIGKPLRVQILESLNYYGQVLQNLHDLDTIPARFPSILEDVSISARKFGKNTKLLAETVREEQDQPYDVPISFDD